MSARSESSPPGARLSIGEVVALLRPEFSDLTDSKIRFLEDRKLISPARTAGGYRSFGPHDVEVLRWILTRQRDQYLPLSIIGERIDRGEHLADIWGIGVTDADASLAEVRASGASVPLDVTGSAEPAEPPPAHEGDEGDDTAETTAAEDAMSETAAGTRARLAGAEAMAGHAPWAADGDDRVYTAAEISAESGLTLDEIAELADYGLLAPLADDDAARSLPSQLEAAQAGATHTEAVQASLGLEPPEQRYGSSALLIARISREFATYGLQARHLRVIRNAAARDASMFEQGIQPILHAGGASASLDAQRSVGRLVALCERLRSVVMREALRRHWR